MKLRPKMGAKFAIVVVARGRKTQRVELLQLSPKKLDGLKRLGGAGQKRVAKEIQDITGKETRCVVLGHLLRGWNPNNF